MNKEPSLIRSLGLGSLLISLLISLLALLDSADHDNMAVPYDISCPSRRALACSSKRSLCRPETNMSHILRIISGIRDDHHLDNEENASQPPDLVDPTGLLMHQYISRHTTKRDEESCTSRNSEKPIQDENVVKHVSSETSSHEMTDSTPPDGGYAWVIAICLMLAVFSTWGTNSAFGVFLNYYLTADAFPGATEYDYALIGGITVALAQGLAPVLVTLYKVLGYRQVCYTGVAIQTLGYILASFATKTWQLYCTQAVLVGISFSLIFIPTTLTLPTWFSKRLATSMGITVAGAGLGGVFFSLVIHKIIQTTGNQRWALRACGIINFAVSTFAVTMVYPYNTKRVPYKTTLTRKYIWECVQLVTKTTIFSRPALLVTALWFGILMMGYIMVLFSVASIGVLVGLTRSQGSNLTVVINAAQTVGRPLIGHFADLMGRTNIASSFSLLLAILVWAFWMNVSSYGALMAFLAVAGLIIGVGSSLSQLIASVILDSTPEELPSAWSWLNIIVSVFQLVLEVIALALRNEAAKRPYQHTQIFGGACFFASFLLISGVREYIVRRTFTRRLDAAFAKLAGRRPPNALKHTDIIMLTDDRDVLEERVARYQVLLQKRYYLIRMFYPCTL